MEPCSNMFSSFVDKKRPESEKCAPIDLIDYRGTTFEIKLAKFLFLKASVLKVMRFALYLVHRSEWFVDQCMHLQLNGKGSAEVEFQFGTTNDRLLGSHTIKPIYDFLVTDPLAQIVHGSDSEEDESNL